MFRSDANPTLLGAWATHGTPAVPGGSPLTVAPIDWRTTGGVLELVGVDADGELHWGEWGAFQRSDPYRLVGSVRIDQSFRSACLTTVHRVAAVTANNAVHWLRATSGKLETTAPPVKLAVPAAAVAVVARPHAGEVAVVFADGSAARVPVPGS